MGTWGPGVFSDDLAADIRTDWRDLVVQRVDDAEATRRIVERYAEELSDDEQADVVWIALAAAQHETGRLNEVVRANALAAIAGGRDVARWAQEDHSSARQRARVLEKLAGRLSGITRARVPCHHVDAHVDPVPTGGDRCRCT